MFGCSNANPPKQFTLTLSKTEISVKVGGTYNLQANYDGDQALVWSSDNPSIATISNGKVKGVSEGSATITVTAGDLSAQCSISVFKLLLGDEVVFVSEGNEPVIDGQLTDSVWENANMLTIDDNVQEYGYVRVLWSESGLYFGAEVFDDTVCAIDRINFWVAETAVAYDENLSYTPDASLGRYYLCVTPYAQLLQYGDGVWSPAIRTIATTRTTEGYNVEVFIPKLSSVNFKEGHMIGLDVSIDYFNSVEEERDFYVDWYGQGHYWSNPSALKAIELICK
jgi:hypothetical protein